MALTLTALQIVHVYNLQPMYSAKRREIRDYYGLTIRTHKAEMKMLYRLSTLMIRPTTMANQPSMRDSHHMSLVKSMRTAECREVSNGADDASLRIDESIVRFGVRALAYAVLMCPPLVRFQLALALSQPNHRWRIEVL